MKQNQLIQGLEELRSQRRKLRGLMWSVALFSVFVNLLMLTAPIYMLQLYDRVLGSRSEATLIALTLLMSFLFLMMGILDYARARILARAGAQFQASLDQRVFSAVMRQSSKNGGTTSGLKDLEALQKLLASPVITAAFDIPWTPFFLFAISIFHPWLGILAIAGGGVLIGITVLNQIMTKGPLTKATIATHHADQMAEQMRVESEMVRALGMSSGAYKRWHQSRDVSLFENLRASDRLGQFSAMSKTFRQFLQSAMLGLGAYLALKGEISPGAMIAGSILLGRALAPVDMAVNQWQLVQRARSGWQALAELLAETPPEQERTALPRPDAKLSVDKLTVIPRGANRAVLRQVTFDLNPGEALGVIGPSGSGKSTLARVLTGVVTPDAGTVRLGARRWTTTRPTHWDATSVICRSGCRCSKARSPKTSPALNCNQTPPRSSPPPRWPARMSLSCPCPTAMTHGFRPGAPPVWWPDAARRTGPRDLWRTGHSGAGRAELEPRQRRHASVE